ncbi:HNH endonuclease signature motif containing protein [uncultured Gemmiger sp.]|uniref:HNH endonuclease signature motif containing protein n=1 Tax=uncultured Gemmiger sp. TaxID=1623490 RepID=UPI00349FA08C
MRCQYTNTARRARVQCGHKTMREFAKAFYKSKAWQRCREGYVSSVGGLCEDCLAKGLYQPGEIVHHMVELNPANINDPAVALSWENLRLLCRDCHAKRHGSHKRYRVDASGRVIPRG